MIQTIKEIKWWIQKKAHSFLDKQLEVTEFSPCTKEAKEHMEHIHRTNGKFGGFKSDDTPIMRDTARKALDAVAQFYTKKVHKTKGRLKK